MEQHSKYRRLPGTRASPSPAARRAAGPLQERSRFIAGPMRGRHQDPQGSAPPLFRPSQRHFAPFPTVPPRSGPTRNGTGRRTGPSRNGVARRAGRSETGTGRRIDPSRNGKAPRIPLPERKNGQRITPPFFPFLSPFAIGHKEKGPRGVLFVRFRSPRAARAADALRPACGPAAWRCAQSTRGSRAPPPWPNRWWARRSTAPRGDSTRASRA